MAEMKITGGRRWENGVLTENSPIMIRTNFYEDMELELEENDMILSGFTDFHAHIWGPGVNIGVSSELFYSEGVVACVEPGHFGYNVWDTADHHWRKHSPVAVKSFVSVLPEGLTKFPPRDTTRPEDISLERLEELYRNADPDRILGFKVVLGWTDAENDRKLLRVGREIADRTNSRLMVHISNACVPFEETAKHMKRGDIVTHIFSGLRNNVLTETGRLHPEVRRLRDLGVIFDIGHAGEHFSWEIFRIATEEGIGFDTLGSDIITRAWKNEEQFFIRDFAHLFSGFANSGMSMEKLLASCTDTPNRIAGFPTYSLQEKLLVLKAKKEKNRYYDGMGDYITGTIEYFPVLFVDDGYVVLDRIH